jgi:hypothetical protein
MPYKTKDEQEKTKEKMKKEQMKKKQINRKTTMKEQTNQKTTTKEQMNQKTMKKTIQKILPNQSSEIFRINLLKSSAPHPPKKSNSIASS